MCHFYLCVEIPYISRMKVLKELDRTSSRSFYSLFWEEKEIPFIEQFDQNEFFYGKI